MSTGTPLSLAQRRERRVRGGAIAISPGESGASGGTQPTPVRQPAKRPRQRAQLQRSTPEIGERMAAPITGGAAETETTGAAAEPQTQTPAPAPEPVALTRWDLSLTMTPIPGEKGAKEEDLDDELRMWVAQNWVKSCQACMPSLSNCWTTAPMYACMCMCVCPSLCAAVMDARLEASQLVEGHWGVERGTEKDNPHAQGANRVLLSQTVEKLACEAVKRWYRPLGVSIRDAALEAFRQRQEDDPVRFKTIRVTCRLAVGKHDKFEYLMGYTGKWWEEPEYLEAMTGCSPVRWLECRDAYNARANDEQNFRAIVKKGYQPRAGAKLAQLNKTNFIGTCLDFLKIADLAKFEPSCVVAIAWMLQCGRFCIAPIFVQEKKGDAHISEPKVEALRKLNAEPLAAIDIELVRLVFYGSREPERVLGFSYRGPWLPPLEVIDELTYVEAMEYKKSGALPLRVQHLMLPKVKGDVLGEALVVDLDCAFPVMPGTGSSAAVDLLRLAHFSVTAHLWPLNTADATGFRAMAAAHLVSSAAKYELRDVTKSSIFQLQGPAIEAFLTAASEDDEVDGRTQLEALAESFGLGDGLVQGPITFDDMMLLLDDQSLIGTRRTWLVIVRCEPLPLEEASPPKEASPEEDAPAGSGPMGAPQLCPLSSTQPFERLADAWMDDGGDGLSPSSPTGARIARAPRPPSRDASPSSAASPLARSRRLSPTPAASATPSAAAQPTAAAMQAHHYLVVWRRDVDRRLAAALRPQDFASHGAPRSPGVEEVRRAPREAAGGYTPGLPAGSSGYDSFYPQ